MKLKNFLIVVKDIEISKKFYKELFGLDIAVEFEGNVILTEGLVLQREDLWREATGKQNVMKSNNCELYFEESYMDGFLIKLENIQWEIEYVNPMLERDWGQRVIRLYDPDGHIVEVGETEESVARRFLDNGMSIEAVSKKMRVPMDYIEEISKKITYAN